MQSISRSKDINLGGLSRIKYAAVDFFESIPRAYNGQISGDIVFKEGFGWLDLEFIQQSGSFTESESLGDDGILYNKRLVCTLNRQSTELSGQLRQIHYQKLIFLVFDQNFYEIGTPPYLVGDPDHWLEYEVGRDTGKAAADFNGYALSFAGKSKFESCFYLGTY